MMLLTFLVFICTVQMNVYCVHSKRVLYTFTVNTKGFLMQNKWNCMQIYMINMIDSDKEAEAVCDQQQQEMQIK